MPQLKEDPAQGTATTPVPDFELSRLAPSRPAHPLWQRLADHPFDDPRDARPLSARLSQNTGWRAAHTQRVLTEYRRFLYLAVRLQGRVCPSEAVDEAWHAHLLDSSRYFGDFCPRVLGYTLHHVPSRGGAEEGARHASRYRATLLAYQPVFGEAPPADIWPAPEARFKERTRHVSSRTHWAFPKPTEWLSASRTSAARAWANPATGDGVCGKETGGEQQHAEENKPKGRKERHQQAAEHHRCKAKHHRPAAKAYGHGPCLR